MLFVAATPKPDAFGATKVEAPITPATPKPNAPASTTPQPGFGGIFARVLKPARIESTVNLVPLKLYEKRVASLPEKLKANQAALDALDKKPAENKTKRDRLNAKKAFLDGELARAEVSRQNLESARAKETPGLPAYAQLDLQITQMSLGMADLKQQISDATDALADLERDDADVPQKKKPLQEEKARLERLLAKAKKWVADPGTASKAPFELLKNSAVALVPDLTVTVELPLTKTWLGLSKNTVNLDSGVLVGYKTEKSSAGVAAGKILVDATGKLLETVARIIPIKIDYSTKEKQLLEAEKALANLKAQIADSKLPGTHVVEVDQLQKEKELLALQVQVAELRATIAKLNAAAK